MDTVQHRERRSAAPARRATETYFCSTSRERNAAGVDAAAFEGGRSYSPDEMKNWLSKTGFKKAEEKLMGETVIIQAFNLR